MLSVAKAAQQPIIRFRKPRKIAEDEDYIKAAEYLRCDDCEKIYKPKQTSKTAPPKPYMFNYEVGVDVLDLHDCEGNVYQFLNIVCQGTDFQLVIYLKKGHGTPSSRLCAEKFMTHWVSWAGWPTEVKVDRGLHNRGYFA